MIAHWFIKYIRVHMCTVKSDKENKLMIKDEPQFYGWIQLKSACYVPSDDPIPVKDVTTHRFAQPLSRQ